MQTVLISGAGIAGPALAYWLKRYGFDVCMVERAETWRTRGYLLDFWGLGYDVAERMGVLPGILADGYQMSEVRIIDRRGRKVAAVSAGVFVAAAAGRYTSLLRGDLAKRVYEGLPSDVEVHFGTSITAIEDTGADVVVSFDSMPDRRFDLVIGADGLHSNVRSLVFGPPKDFERYLGYYTAAFDAPHYPHRDEDAYISFSLPGRQIARYALRDGSSAFFFILARPEALDAVVHDAAAQRRLLHEEFDGTGWESAEILQRLDSSNSLYFDAVSQAILPTWWRGRVALVGDAAYCPSLLAGQGSSFAMAGAYKLADCNGDYAQAFQAYQDAFKPYLDKKQKQARGFAAWFAPRTKWGMWVRNKITNVMGWPVVGNLMARWAFRDLPLEAFGVSGGNDVHAA